MKRACVSRLAVLMSCSTAAVVVVLHLQALVGLSQAVAHPNPTSTSTHGFSNMNGEYIITPTPNPTPGTFSTKWSEYNNTVGGVESFDVYMGPIEHLCTCLTLRSGSGAA